MREREKKKKKKKSVYKTKKRMNIQTKFECSSVVSIVLYNLV